MRQQLNDLLESIKKVNLIESFPNHDIYIWSNYVFNESPDIDLKFVGEVNNEIADKVSMLSIPKPSGIIFDPTLYTNTKIFEHIPRFNRCTDDIYYFDEEIIRYKIRSQKNNEYNGREVEELGPRLFKIKQIFARKDGKYKHRHWTYPILLKDLL